MDLASIYHKLVLISPKVEVMLRCFYWNNVKFFKRFKNNSENINGNITGDINLDKILSHLRDNGVQKNDILVIHSSYDAIQSSKLSPEDIIDKLYELVNEGGTIAMPAIRMFEEETKNGKYLDNYLKDEPQNFTTLYNVYQSPIIAGLLPFTLMRYDDAVISEFPLNPMTAIGVHSKSMIENNTKGMLPAAHGPNSAWSYCAQHNAWNIGIGVDIKDYLTIFHVLQENDEWPVKDWFFERDFIIKKGKREYSLRIRERRHKWTKYFAELNFYNDLQKAGVLHFAKIDGIPIYMTRTSDLFKFIRSNKNSTYPYYLPSKFKLG